MNRLSRVVGFFRRHKKGEEAVAIGVTIWSVERVIAAVVGAGIASAAIVGANMIDLSNNNGAAAASAIAAPRVQLVEAKATEGLAFHDPDYPTFRTAARDHHKAFGGYLFLHPGESGKAQADYFLAYAKPHRGDVQPVVDSEIGSPCAAAPTTVAALQELVRKGFDPILYSNTYWLGQFAQCAPALKRYRMWEAEYGPTLTLIPGFHVVSWQFTDRAQVNGLAVDGSQLLVRSAASLEIGHTKKPTPTQQKAKALAVRKAHLRTLAGYFSWFEWRTARSRWKRLTPAERDARPNVPHHIRHKWWLRFEHQQRAAA